MKKLSPHIHLLKDGYNTITCRSITTIITFIYYYIEMGLSSDGLQYLLESLKSIDVMLRILDISQNNFDSNAETYMMNYLKENHNIGMYFS